MCFYRLYKRYKDNIYKIGRGVSDNVCCGERIYRVTMRDDPFVILSQGLAAFTMNLTPYPNWISALQSEWTKLRSFGSNCIWMHKIAYLTASWFSNVIHAFGCGGGRGRLMSFGKPPPIISYYVIQYLCVRLKWLNSILFYEMPDSIRFVVYYTPGSQYSIHLFCS